MSNIPFRRVILKISGETFCPPGSRGIDPSELSFIANQVKLAASTGCQVAVVVGGGNIVRGSHLVSETGFDQSTADYMGMIGTVVNGLALREALNGLDCDVRLMSALEIPAVAEPFIKARAMRHLEKGRILVLAAGTGNPFFTTDTCAALRGAEIVADVLLKATKVDGVYDADPVTNPKAIRYDEITFHEAIEQQLGVMDLTALTMCMENNLPVVIFNFRAEGAIHRVILGDTDYGTLVHVGKKKTQTASSY